MNFMFEWQEQYLTSECSQRVRYCFLPREHKIHTIELTCNVIFIIETSWWRRFWRFCEDFQLLFEDFRKFLKTYPNVTRSMRINCRKFQKISEDTRRFLEIAEYFRRWPKTFRSYTNELKNNLRDKLYSSGIIDTLTSEDMENTPLEARM